VQRNRPPSAQAISVLRALAADPARWRYGYDLATEVHLKSGSLYPILVRFADRGLLETGVALLRRYAWAVPAVRDDVPVRLLRWAAAVTGGIG